MKKSEIIEALDKAGIEYDASAKKAELEALLEDNSVSIGYICLSCETLFEESELLEKAHICPKCNQASIEKAN